VNLRRIFADLNVFGKGYMRNPLGVFFSILFPLILIGLFGLIFSATASTTVTLYTENFDHHSNASVALLAALNSTGVIKVQVIDPSSTGGDFSHWLSSHNHPVGLVIPAGFGAAYANRSNASVQLYINPLDQSSSGIAEGTVQSALNGLSFKAVGGRPFLSEQTTSVAGPVFKYIDYLVPGLIGFSILTSPMFAMVDITSSYRKEHLFRQLSLTPLTKGEWLVSKVVWYVLLTFVSAAVMVATGTFAFGAHVTLSLGLLPFLILGPFFFVSLGMLAGSAAKTPETAALIGNIITFPMMFLSGTFFPVSSFPAGLQSVVRVLPLFYVIDGMNQVMLFSNASGALTDVLVILVGSILVFIAAIWVFKWRDE
jgi:ABC-2 type transport system permease protein